MRARLVECGCGTVKAMNNVVRGKTLNFYCCNRGCASCAGQRCQYTVDEGGIVAGVRAGRDWRCSRRQKINGYCKAHARMTGATPPRGTR